MNFQKLGNSIINRTRKIIVHCVSVVMLLAMASVAEAITISAPSSDEDGTYSVSFSGNTKYFAYVQRKSGTNWYTQKTYTGTTASGGYTEYSRSIGTKHYRIRSCDRSSGGGAYNCTNSDQRAVSTTNNKPPTIVGLHSVEIPLNGSITIPFTISDDWLSPNDLNVFAQFSGGTAILGGSGANRTVTLTPPKNQYGSWGAAVVVVEPNGEAARTQTLGVTVSKLVVGPDSDNDGTFTISWQVNTSYSRVRELQSDGSWKTVATSSFSSSSQLSRSNGRYTYRLDEHTVIGSQYGHTDTHEVVETKSITINVPKPVISASFSAAAINEAGSSTLSWNATNAQSCSATGISGVSGTSGSVTYKAANEVLSQQTINVTVTCSGPGGETSKSSTLTINPINDTPDIFSIPAVSMLQNVIKSEIVSFSVNDVDNNNNSLKLKALSSTNPALVPVSNVVFGGSGSNRTVYVKPVSGKWGVGKITVELSDGYKKRTATLGFTVHQPPVFNVGTGVSPASIKEGKSATFSWNVSNADSCTATGVSKNSIGTTDSWPYTAEDNLVASTTKTITLNCTGLGGSRSKTISLSINATPAFMTVPEDSNSGEYVITFGSCVDECWLIENPNAGGNVVAKTTRKEIKTESFKKNDGTYTYQLLSCTYSAQPSGPPTPSCHQVGEHKSVRVDQPAPTVLSNFSSAPINEGEDTSFMWQATDAVSCESDQFPLLTGVVESGNYDASDNLSEDDTEDFSVTCTGPGGAKTSSLTLPIYWVNDAPSLGKPYFPNWPEDTSKEVGFHISDEETSFEELEIEITSSNGALISPSKVLITPIDGATSEDMVTAKIKITPNLNMYGTASITLKVVDKGDSDHPANTVYKTFDVTVTPVNDEPVFEAIESVTVNRVNGPTFEVPLDIFDAETAPGDMPITFGISNSALVPTDTINFVADSDSCLNENCRLVITPAAGEVGQAIITVILWDGAGVRAQRSFYFTVEGEYSEFHFNTQAPDSFKYDLTDTSFIPDITAPDFVAITQGGANVRNGAANYSLPIVVPPAVNNLGPNIGFNYSSRLGNGVMGMGWQVSGFSSIYRCKPGRETYGSEATGASKKYETSDRLCFDGTPLLLSASENAPASDANYWAENAEYQTEIANFSKIVASGSQGNGHESFVVWLKNGNKLYFGDESDGQNSRIKQPGLNKNEIKRWALDKVEDSYGNLYTIHYEQDPTISDYRPHYIKYSPEAMVVFEYRDREGDLPWGYELGHRFERKKVLEYVTTYVDATDISSLESATRVRQYRVAYEAGAATNRDRVSSITKCGYNIAQSVWQCASPLAMDWHDGAVGFEAAVALETCSGTALDDIGTTILDFDGDGYNDIIDYDGSIMWGTVEGCFDEIVFTHTGASNSSVDFAVPAMTPQGRALMVQRGVGNRKYIDFKYFDKVAETSNSVAWHNFGCIASEDTSCNILPGDFNADGYDDFKVWKPATINEITVRSYFYIQNGTYYSTLPSESYYRSALSNVQLINVNSDGIPDLMWLNPDNSADEDEVNLENDSKIRISVSTLTSALPYYTSLGAMLVNGTKPFEYCGYCPAGPKGIRFRIRGGMYFSEVDINGDGLNDIFYHRRNDEGNVRWHVAYNKGDATTFFNPVELDITSRTNQYSYTYDFNKDGREDLLTGANAYLARYKNGSISYVEATDEKGGDFGTVLSGNGKSVVNTTTEYYDENIANIFRGDFNNDGLIDMYREGNVYYAKRGQPDLLSTVTNGLGVVTGFEYSELVDDQNENGKPIYTPVQTTYPELPVQRSIQIVKDFYSSNGQEEYNHVYFNYTGAKVHANGRGYLGFEKIETTNTTAGLESETLYRQDFPFIGRVAEATVRETSGTLLSKSEHFYTTHPDNSRVVYQSTSVSKQYQLTTASESEPISVSKVEYEYDEYGTLTSQSTKVGTGYTASGVDLVVTGVLSEASVTNSDVTHDTENWLLGFIGRSEIDSAANDDTKTVVYEYDAEPGTLDVATVRAFVGTEMETQTTVTRNLTDENIGLGMVTGTTTSANDYDGSALGDRGVTLSDFSEGIFPQTITNALDHSVTTTVDNRYGNVLTVADPNTLTTTSRYDALGRLLEVESADGTVSKSKSYFCDSAPFTCPENAKIVVANETVNSNSSLPYELGTPLTVSYFDILQRPIREEVYLFNGEVVKVDTEYYADGRVYRVSEPYRITAAHWTVYTGYDSLNRPETVEHPNGGSVTVVYGQEDSILTAEITTTVVDSYGGTSARSKTSYTNALGQLARVEDAEDIPVSYSYDAHGNLATTIVNDDALTTISAVFDVAGRKMELTDPDAGTIGFDYNGFGELRVQTWGEGETAKSIAYGYDVLGRKTSRLDTPAEGATTSFDWTWDQNNKVGTLSTASGNGYSEAYRYDSLLRLDQVTANVAGLGERRFGYSYDVFSRLETESYPSGLVIERQYSAAGMPVRTLNQSDSNLIIWALGDDVDNRGMFTHSLYGNGVITERTYDSSDGSLNSILSARLHTSNPFSKMLGNIQALSYGFDSLGNLDYRYSQRSDWLGETTENFSETFEYDDLNRVQSSTTMGLTVSPRVVDYGYDDLGNLNYKSDVGADGIITYDPDSTNNAGVHAATGAAGVSYGYDAYGNMVTRGSDTLDYDVFNKPTQLGDVQFTYGPDHQRFKQVNGDKTTYYLAGGAFEEVVEVGLIDSTQKTTVDGFYVHTQTSVTTEVNYLLFDHLGSVETVTDDRGGIVERLSFDPWGNRQMADWKTGRPSVSDVTTRGFTGHEQLDELGLIHMNGRVYDPLIGRFLSPDIFVVNPTDSQAFNRYSYVRNNPLSAVDPSGYFEGDAYDEELSVYGSASQVVTVVDNPAPVIDQGVPGVDAPELPKRTTGGPQIGIIDASIARSNAEFQDTLAGNVFTPSYGEAQAGSITDSSSSGGDPTPNRFNGMSQYDQSEGVGGSGYTKAHLMGVYDNFMEGIYENSGLGLLLPPSLAEYDFTRLSFWTGKYQSSFNTSGFTDEQRLAYDLGPVTTTILVLIIAKRVNPAALGRSGVAKSARTPVGRSGQQNNFPNPNAPKPRNAPETINGRDYSGHAIDRMQERGYTPSVIENALQNGARSAGNKPNTSLYTDTVNKLRVVTNSETGNVITVIPGLK